MEITYLYSVTTINSTAKMFRDRTVANCLTVERAKLIVERNDLDIHEDEYDLAVIEQYAADVPYGTVGDHNVWWYEWNTELERYESRDTPKQFEHISGFWE
jgi:hypothetical protein